MKTLKGTKTAENLMKAFAGECQARTKYTYYSSTAKKEGYVQIANIFMETAENEKEHAKRFLKFLNSNMQNDGVEITACYGAGLGTTIENLKYAANGEHEEWSELYPHFGKVAEEEGFDEIAQAFYNISKVEKRHEERYRKLLENIENDQVFKKDEVILWKCSNCGYIYEGKEAPKVCPSCIHPQGYFEVFVENY
ncbi:rubrerythrin family protein [Clostridium sp. MB40-C1]|uniref:rubrerythrin n=1 Tax=Clostridium sp. MB40-C1 TaxID=3070996 RepID=UPI0027E03396|nr:rubrerythrin family protein [Clostridium sp. MB40-C1]WMJ81852.1 rubrerythrin family protein [Clostridium sp. MB40-C1]